jgi:hypothetical protein
MSHFRIKFQKHVAHIQNLNHTQESIEFPSNLIVNKIVKFSTVVFRYSQSVRISSQILMAA